MKISLIVIAVATFHYVIADQIAPAVPCKSDHDCTDMFNTMKDTFCKAGYCMCGNGTAMKNCSSADITHHNNRSNGPAFRTCKINQDCTTPGGICNTTISRCECQKDYVFSVNRQECLKKAETIDYPCIDDKQCSSAISNTTCQNGQCNCIAGFHYSENNCYKSIAFGSTCTKNQDCSHVDGAVCNERNVCGCPAETVINSNKTICLKVSREYRDECVEDVQCNITFSNSLCIDKTCQCRYQYHFESEMNRCFNDRAFDEDCGNNFECYQEENDNATVKALECLSNKCVCAENFYRENDRCVTAAAHFVEYAPLLFVLSTFIHVAFQQI